jgi:hypothetical protein
MAVSPTVEARRWMQSTLNADGVLAAALGGRIFEVPAPPDAADPFLAVQQYQSPADVYTNGAILIMTHVYYKLIVAQRGTSVSSPFNIEAIDQRITQVLHGKSGTTTTGAQVIECVRVGPALVAPDFDKRTGAQYAQLGSNWHLVVQ